MTTGQYLIELNIHLLQDDDLYPGRVDSSAQFMLTVR
jgi:hypothetical protein